MKITITEKFFSLTQPQRDWIEAQLRDLARVRPLIGVALHVTVGISVRVTIAIETTDDAVLRAEAAGSLESALDVILIEASKMLQVHGWVVDGAPAPCRWCSGRAFAYLGSVGEDVSYAMPTHRLACTECGHIEVFIVPRALALDMHRTAKPAIHALGAAPYR